MRETVLIAAIFFIALLAFSANAQPAGYVEIFSLKTLPSKKLGCSQLKSGVYDYAKLAELSKDPQCAEHIPSFTVEEDENHSLVYFAVASDCNMKVAVKVFRVDAEKKYKAIINNIYGGCRAGGRRSGWVVFEKPLAGYQVETIEVRVDRIHRNDLEGVFKFPDPPSVVTKEAVDVREIYLQGCLPLTGQSQWIINSKEHLERAIAASPDVARCRKVIDEANIDTAASTLIGYSFASGHCERPPSLSFEAVSEISSNVKENRYLITARYDDAGADHCTTWTTYGVWLLVPKAPVGLRFDLQTKARK